MTTRGAIVSAFAIAVTIASTSGLYAASSAKSCRRAVAKLSSQERITERTFMKSLTACATLDDWLSAADRGISTTFTGKAADLEQLAQLVPAFIGGGSFGPNGPRDLEVAGVPTLVEKLVILCTVYEQDGRVCKHAFDEVASGTVKLRIEPQGSDPAAGDFIPVTALRCDAQVEGTLVSPDGAETALTEALDQTTLAVRLPSDAPAGRYVVRISCQTDVLLIDNGELVGTQVRNVDGEATFEVVG